jgi:dolichol-phosphate mannosyltransferase
VTEAPELSVVLPAFNESQNLPQIVAHLYEVLAEIAEFEVIVVDDGSEDDTLAVARNLSREDTRVRYLSLSRNFGHQQALRAGIAASRGRCVITMDADFQHPPSLLPDMLRLWRGGNDVVRTVRADGAGESWLKRWSARAFYRLLNAISDYQIEPGSADFCLMDRRVVDVICAMPEREVFLRGLLSWVGFRSATLRYVPDLRRHGASKYGFRRMVSLAGAGIVSSSIQPLRAALLLAAVVAALAAVYMLYAIGVYVLDNTVVPGWTSVVIVVAFLGALQLLILGIIGEYIGRVLRETRGRPGYVVAETEQDPAGAERGA